MDDDRVQPAREVGDPERREAGPAPDFELVRPYVSAMVDQEPGHLVADPVRLVRDPADPATVQMDRIVVPADGAGGTPGRWKARAVPLAFAGTAVVIAIALVSAYVWLSGSNTVAMPAPVAAAGLPSIPAPSPAPASPSSSSAPAIKPVPTSTAVHRATTAHPPTHRSAAPSLSPSQAPSVSGSQTPKNVPTPPPPAPPLPAVTGAIVGFGGMCLDDNGAVNPDGNRIQIYSCNSSAAQVWTWESDGTLQVVGKCLQVTGLGAGSVTELWDCDGSASEVWWAGRRNTIINATSGLCLDDPGSSTSSGTQVDIAGCSRTSNQQWTLQP